MRTYAAFQVGRVKKLSPACLSGRDMCKDHWRLCSLECNQRGRSSSRGNAFGSLSSCFSSTLGAAPHIQLRFRTSFLWYILCALKLEKMSCFNLDISFLSTPAIAVAAEPFAAGYNALRKAC